MKSIGGYFELELMKGKEFHSEAVKLNAARNALEYILRANEYTKIYLPYYTCDVVLEPVEKLGLEYEFYHIGQDFFPKLDISGIKDREVFLYTNYFGICDKQVKQVVDSCNNIIIDNSQAFFSEPIKGVDTFYSPRKFFGVPDGAYLYTKKMLREDFEQDKSKERCDHLLGRIEDGAESHYLEFKGNDKKLRNQPIKMMSRLTESLLKSIDYDIVAKKRRENYEYLDKVLKNNNQLDVSIENYVVPMVYPYLTNKKDLREYLLENKIFVAKYWPNVQDWVEKGTLEYKLQENLLPLPIDQRYDISDMKLICDKIINYGEEN